MSEIRNGKCDNCGAKRRVHAPNADGLRLMCPFEGGGRFAWARSEGRAGTSFSAAQIDVLDTLVAHAMGASAGVSRNNPELLALRRKTLHMRKTAMKDPA